MLAGTAEKALVEVLEVGAAQTQRVCELVDGPVCGGGIVDLRADAGKFTIIFWHNGRLLLCTDQFFMQRTHENVHEPVDDLLAMDSVRVKFIGDQSGVIRQPAKIARLQDRTIWKMERAQYVRIRFRQVKVDPVIVVVIGIAAIVDRCAGREEQDGIWRDGAFPIAVIIPGILFDQQKKIVVEPGGMQDVTGLFVTGVVAAVQYVYHNLPP